MIPKYLEKNTTKMQKQSAPNLFDIGLFRICLDATNSKLDDNSEEHCVDLKYKAILKTPSSHTG